MDDQPTPGSPTDAYYKQLVSIDYEPIPISPTQTHYEQRLAAIRGERVPDDIDSQFGRASLIRGIRCHFSFAASQAVKDVCVSRPEFARARNARLIMSNMIPGPEDMVDSDRTRQPYCIWYPDFATEDTYRQLAQHFPSMRYQVGRACAAAGYSGLFSELDLLPDVSIAEEARESGTTGGRIIFDTVMAAPYRYAVLDDYTLSVNLENPNFPVYLSGDTEVRWKLQKRKSLPSGPRYGMDSADEHRPSIEEDERINDKWDDWPRDYDYLTHEETKLLYNPLPLDLPTVKKTLLIQMAAHDGNVDRYARLASPSPMERIEQLCVIRGIYHHTMFARFWLAEIEKNSLRVQRLERQTLACIRSAISARRIMINDTQEFHNGWPEDVKEPNLIWWPLKPREDTLRELAERAPTMKRTAAIACIFCDYNWLYQSLNCRPDDKLVLAARNSRNPFYLQDLERRATEEGIQLNYPLFVDEDEEWLQYDLEPTEKELRSRLLDDMDCMYDCGYLGEGPYGCFGGRADTGLAERYVWAPLELLRKLKRCGGWINVPTGVLEDMTESELEDLVVPTPNDFTEFTE
ncbi:hypothetical protein PRK78_006555 [Emydomyces testavorans]|uniref:Uncharacterized protein n=1 Tax=Emydomyces testavorans TaxID=2070801 RepID=A0AAF0DLK7_9EURO|nr:hypothetical protein PRK78_006555 [Emydomyces testavorans]